MNDFYLSELIAWIVNFKSDNKLFGYDHFFLKKKLTSNMCTLLYVKRKENKYIFYSKSKKEMNEFCCAIALTVFFLNLHDL